MDNLFFKEEHKMIQNMVCDFAKDEILPIAKLTTVIESLSFRLEKLICAFLTEEGLLFLKCSETFIRVIQNTKNGEKAIIYSHLHRLLIV